VGRWLGGIGGGGGMPNAPKRIQEWAYPYNGHDILIRLGWMTGALSSLLVRVQPTSQVNKKYE